MACNLNGTEKKSGIPISNEMRVNGMPLKAIRKMLRNPRTPAQLKRAWREKLKLRGIMV